MKNATMTWNRFVTRPGLLQTLIRYFGIITTDTRMIYIDHQPDYDISHYDRHREPDYYFRNKYQFHHVFDVVITAHLSKICIYAEGDLFEMGQQLELRYDRNHASTFIDAVRRKAPDLLTEYAYDTQLDQYKLYELRVQSIDNNTKDIVYEGGFRGDHGTDSEVMLFATIDIEGIPWHIHHEAFYKSLLAEAFQLWKEEKYKLAYFVAFSALDNYINLLFDLEVKPDSIEELKNMRLNEKFNKLIKLKFLDISKHIIYSSSDRFFTDFINKRNTIAHGSNHVNIDATLSEQVIIYVATMVLCWEHTLYTFAELLELISYVPPAKPKPSRMR